MNEIGIGHASTMTIEKTTHKTEVVRVDELIKVANSDRLSTVKVYDYASVVLTNEWQPGDLAAWIQPDSVVDVTRPEFAFLAPKATDNKVRIRTTRLRGVLSYGLLVKAPVGSKIGDDVSEALGVVHWEPDETPGFSVHGGENAKSPSGVFPTYDVDAYLKFGRLVFVPGEPVFITEKIQGANGKCVFKDGQQYCGTRTQWKKEFPSKPTQTYEEILAQFENDEAKAKSAWRKIENWKPKRSRWWSAFHNSPGISEFCKANPGYALYGEVYGQVGGYHYGIENGESKFFAFDILTPDGQWLDFPNFLDKINEFGIPHVPILHQAFPFDFDAISEMANGHSLVPNAENIREGVVVGTVKERWDERLGRVKLKVINPDY